MIISHLSTTTSQLHGNDVVPAFHELVKARTPFSIWVDLGEEQLCQYKVDNGIVTTSTEESIKNLLRKKFGIINFS